MDWILPIGLDIENEAAQIANIPFNLMENVREIGNPLEFSLSPECYHVKTILMGNVSFLEFTWLQCLILCYFNRNNLHTRTDIQRDQRVRTMPGGENDIEKCPTLLAWVWKECVKSQDRTILQTSVLTPSSQPLVLVRPNIPVS